MTIKKQAFVDVSPFKHNTFIIDLNFQRVSFLMTLKLTPLGIFSPNVAKRKGRFWEPPSPPFLGGIAFESSFHDFPKTPGTGGRSFLCPFVLVEDQRILHT